MILTLFLILTSTVATMGAQFDVYGYTSKLERIDSSYLLCNSDKRCQNVYNSILATTNASYVCFYPYDSDCYSYDLDNTGLYRSFGISCAPFYQSPANKMDNTIFESSSFGMNIIMQCMNYDEMIMMTAFCLENYTKKLKNKLY